jgi:hypothetical protein
VKIDGLIDKLLNDIYEVEKRNEPYLKGGIFSKIRQLSETKLNLMN